jgi:hypothetical protein
MKYRIRPIQEGFFAVEERNGVWPLFQWDELRDYRCSRSKSIFTETEAREFIEYYKNQELERAKRRKARDKFIRENPPIYVP